MFGKLIVKKSCYYLKSPLTANYQIFTPPSQKAAAAQGSQAAAGAAGAARHRSLPREAMSIPLLLGSDLTHRCCQAGGSWREGYLPLCPPGWQTAVNPNYDLSQSWTNYKLSAVIYQKIIKWIDFMDLKLLNLTPRTGAYSAWNPHERNPYECGECKAGNALSYSKGMDICIHQHYLPLIYHIFDYSTSCTYLSIKYWQKQP